MQTQTREEMLTTREPTMPMTPDRPNRRATFTSSWLAPLIVLLLVGGFMAGYFTGRAEGTDPKGLAPQAMVDKIDSFMQASNAADSDVFKAFFADDAVLILRDQSNSDEITGAEAITGVLMNGTVERTTEVVVRGPLYSFGYRHTDSSGIIVMRFDSDELIKYMWVII